MTANLTLLYASKKEDIRKRLEDYKKVWYEDDKRIFSELAFCLCTPQTKASAGDLAVKRMVADNSLFTDKWEQLQPHLAKAGVRFSNNKSRYIVEAREFFSRNQVMNIKSKLNTSDIVGLRNWLADNVKGLGMKEASNFLRNIGFGKDLAILDRHILRNMVKYEIIPETPKTISKKTYLEMEEVLRKFAKSSSIGMDEIDLLFWSEYGSLPISEMK